MYYCTSYCNHGHSRVTGKPLDHECYVLPPAALQAEVHGDIEEAIRLLEAAKPLRTHGGTRCRHEWTRRVPRDRWGNPLGGRVTHCEKCGKEK